MASARPVCTSWSDFPPVFSVQKRVHETMCTEMRTRSEALQDCSGYIPSKVPPLFDLSSPRLGLMTTSIMYLFRVRFWPILTLISLRQKLRHSTRLTNHRVLVWCRCPEEPTMIWCLLRSVSLLTIVANTTFRHRTHLEHHVLYIWEFGSARTH